MKRIRVERFGVTRQGEPVERLILENETGMQVSLLSYGCTVQSVLVPDRQGKLRDVVLGYDHIQGYEEGSCYFGAFVGRYANRIKGARFQLNGRTYCLEPNDGRNHLHGVYCRQVFEGTAEGEGVVFRRVSPAGEEGYPGRVELRVSYRLTEENGLVIEYRAVTDADTVINLTNHSYFNLNGQDGSQILDHVLYLSADRFTEADRETLPTGTILPVEGTVMDFREGKPIGRDILSPWPQLAMCRGYDHNYILPGGQAGPAARVYSAASGLTLECYTTQPAVQLYTGNFVDGDAAPCGKGGLRYPRYGGFCLETQHYPCSPNFPAFPSTLLRPGEVYSHRTEYRFLREEG